MTNPAQRSPAPPGSKAQRALFVIAFCAFFTASMFDAWNRQTEPIFPRRPHPVVGSLPVLAAQPDYGSIDSVVVSEKSPYPRWTNAFAERGPDYYRTTMRAQIFWFLLLAAATAAAAALTKSSAGVTAGVWLVFAPLTALLTLAWDDHLANAVFTMAALALLAASSDLRRPARVALAGLLAGFAVRFSFIPSNGLLAVATVTSGLAGLSLERMLRGTPRDGSKTPPAPWWKATLGLVGFVVALYWIGFRHESLESINPAYYMGEADSAFATDGGPWSGRWAGLLTYGYWIVRSQLGYAGVVIVLIGLGGLIMGRPRGAGLWLGASIAPLIALSAVTKKNPYYDVYAVLALIPAAAVGWEAWARSRARTIALAVLTVLLVAGAHYRLWYADGRVSEHPILRHFQEPAVFELGRPRVAPHPEAEWANVVAGAIRARAPQGDALLLIPGDEVRIEATDALRYYLALRDSDIALLITQTAWRLPFDTKRAFVLLWRKNPEDRPDLSAVLASSARFHREGGSTFAENGGASFLETLAADAAAAVPIAESDVFLLYEVDAP